MRSPTLGNPRRNVGSRTVIWSMSIFCVLGGAIAAFGSTMKMANRIQNEADRNYVADSGNTAKIQDMNRDAALAKERERLGIAKDTGQLILTGYAYNEKSFFQDMRQYHEAIASFAKDGKLVLTDPRKSIVGTYENGFLCDRKGACQKLNLK